ncbi:baseplate assembly protein [Salinicola acroporae]|uniref:Baseplate assembly protein n=1 Tax=Salinicola acroporae TaxID=1541440 RepID=A0ABT6I041_9GAMM|nr:baseplate J/gp47 family protein [Salinicola acroporae]MDH4571099.1 baseplate assembly protein [Salinicola acroporae]
MSGGFTAVDLSRLPAPAVVEEIEFEAIFESMLADLRERDPSFDVTVESDPAYKVLQVAAYREMLLRQRINEAAKGVMLAYAIGSDLDHLGALYGVERQMLSEGDPDAIPPVPATYETDADFRRRIQLSLEGFSTAGPEGAYVFHALSADGAVLDASATSPSPGEVVVTVLSRNDNGNAPASLLEVVNRALSAEDVRPLTDHVTVQTAQIIEYRIDATLYFYAGPDREVVMRQARDRAAEYTEQQHRLGLDVTMSGLYAALHQPGVQRVEIAEPAASIVVDRTQATYCTAIDLTDGGLDE